MSSLLRSGKVITRFSPAESPFLGQFPEKHQSPQEARAQFQGLVCRGWAQGQGVPEPSPHRKPRTLQ